jgi:dTDP-4-dehydrorhamnose 3,5-epimerase-like enzyme
MEVIKTAIDGVFILEPRIFNDETKCFFKMRKYSANLLKFK